MGNHKNGKLNLVYCCVICSNHRIVEFNNGRQHLWGFVLSNNSDINRKCCYVPIRDGVSRSRCRKLINHVEKI